MSAYQVLARKYRPKNFSELLGQSHVSNALSNAIDSGRIHHAYLFTGTRGVGKTTIARILAKCLNCETGITSTPCGVCDTCVSVDSGRFIDLIEIDAASRTKVEDTRDLLENVPYAPTQGHYKVYLIDEVHMLSTHSFNALLKTLEEPPEHVKFILATTDPQKLPITVVSRCLQFVLRPLSQELLYQHLAYILDCEKIGFSDKAVWQLAQSAKGSVRDALSLTDQAIAFGGGHLDDDTVSGMLGLVDSLDVLALVGDIFADNRQAVATHIQRMRMQMVDATSMLDKMVDTFHQLALVQILPDVPLDMNDTQKQAFLALAQTIPSDVLQLYYEIASKSRESVRLASTPMQALEMGILRLLAFRPLAINQMTVPVDNLTDDNLTDDNLTDDNLTDDNLTDDNLTDDNLTDDNLTDDNLTDDNEVSQDTEILEADHQAAQTSPPNLHANEMNLNGDLTNKQRLQQQLIAPQVDMVGDWTPEKWDYWVTQARQHGWLSVDELALVSHGLMTGQIAGQCQLYMSDENKQTVVSFEGFLSKYATLMPDAQLLGYQILTDDMRCQVPVIKQQQRKTVVDTQIEQQLLQSPVLTQLWQMGYIEQTGASIMVVKSFLE